MKKFKCRNFALVWLLLGAISAGIVGGCSTAQQCSSEPPEGNLGSVVNSSDDEFAPIQFGKSTLLISSTNKERQRKKTPDDEAVLASDFRKGSFTLPALAATLPMNAVPNSGYPTFYANSITKITEVYFAARTGTGIKTNVNLFSSSRRAIGEWSAPQMLDMTINSPTWDDQPAIAPDGSVLIFASDRPGGMGGIDLYKITRNPDRTWSKPENLGEKYNSQYDEFSPYIAPDGTFYYATKSQSEGKHYDIMSASKDAAGWGEPKALPAPINSEYDDISPSWWGDSLLIASNRKGGCGGYDLYAFQLCGPVIVRGAITPPAGKTVPMSGKIDMLDESGSLLASTKVNDDGGFSFPVPPRKKLLLRYVAPCVPGKYEQRITTECSETSAIMMNVDFAVPESAFSFTLDTSKYNIPFFVSGYYVPNTQDNLSDLRLKFAYNLLGNNDSSRYISKPTEEYDAYAVMVDSALGEAYEFIVQRFGMLEYNPCVETGKSIEINVEGYADPRGIYGQARYVGEDIADEKLNIHVRRGEKMTNELLSELRAYYTAKYLQDKIEKHPLYAKYASQMHWQAAGKGIDEQEHENERKRRVGIYVKMVPKDADTGK